MVHSMYDLRNAPKIAIFGSDGDHCTSSAENVAYATGLLLAQQGAIVYTGGGNGVMAAACQGVRDGEGITISITPWDGKESERRGNPHSTIVIPTGMGYARCQILVNSVEGAIAIGGVGTLQEVASMYLDQKPVVSIVPSGGIAAEVAGKVLDGRNLDQILSAETPEEAVRLVLEKVRAKRS